MLISFEVENLLSFNEPVQLSMVPLPKQRLHKDHVINPANTRLFPLLRFAVIYGANAAGKSNLVRAMELVRELIEDGTHGGGEIDCPRFKLVPERLLQPAQATFKFRISDRQFAYRIAFDNERIWEERLDTISASTGKKDLVFQRHTEDSHVTVDIGTHLVGKGKKKIDRDFLSFVAQGTRPNQPFLTEARERNVEALIDIHEWFASSLKVLWPTSQPVGIELQVERNDEFREFLGKILSDAGTGIDKIETITKPIERADIPGTVLKSLQDDLLRRTSKSENAFLIIGGPLGDHHLVSKTEEGELHIHKLIALRGYDQDSVAFDLDELSDGARRLIELSASLWELLKGKKDRIIVIDEVDRSLHPYLLEMFIRLYMDHDEDPSNSQLIITTHQTNLLDLELLRKDEVWFAEKRQDGSSDLYSLADFEPRHDKDIRKDYLLGRYGAIPYIGNYAALTQDQGDS
ncbi:MAG: hypothetical protein ETSY2_38390 [Candidatus Entotheonella gemina]|uniref:ATPase AAA-type core domain-containing protein n=1 Tax=Candidatus Entotheonella gemina TaxID=1429439 RepID=W4LSL1_9BACT|nr:MAG: hypothetical protein ETSY2_38390 [Candidatus Entotheonella gemina]